MTTFEFLPPTKKEVNAFARVRLSVCLTRGFKMVLFTASRGDNFVGSTCAPASALLVLASVT